MNNSPIQSEHLQWRLKNADAILRWFITAFLSLVTCGYAIGLLFVDHTTAGTTEGIAAQFRGAPESANLAELKYAKTPTEVYTFLHNHVLSLSLIFFVVGGLLYFSSTISPAVKGFLIIEPFLAIATTFGGIWLMWSISEHFSWLVIISGISMVGCYLVMVFLILRELWMKKAE